jgi:chemotaxis response regulator CheB
MNPSEQIRPCRVLLVDDSESYRTALSKLLSREKDVSIVGEASNGRAALDLTIRLRPDVIIMDVMCPRLLKNVMILRHSVAVGVGSPSEI